MRGAGERIEERAGAEGDGRRARRGRRRAVVVPLLLAALVAGAVGCDKTPPPPPDPSPRLAPDSGSPAPVPTRPPAGRTDYVVSLGSLHDGFGDNWVELATYSFSPQGTVEARAHHWDQQDRRDRVDTGTLSLGCASVPTCGIRTAPGFLGEPDVARSGSYTESGDEVRIVWSDGSWEEWGWTTARGDRYARIDLLDASRADHGEGFGSNAPLDARSPVADIRQAGRPLPYRGTTWIDGKVGAIGASFDASLYETCATTTSCMTYRQATTSGCDCPGSADKATNYYLAQVGAHDRRDAWDHWCDCLAQGRHETCYTGNSHTKPLLQILDDDGRWVGWVGAEVFSDQTGGNRDVGYFSTFSIAEAF